MNTKNKNNSNKEFITGMIIGAAIALIPAVYNIYIDYRNYLGNKDQIEIHIKDLHYNSDK